MNTSRPRRERPSRNNPNPATKPEPTSSEYAVIINRVVVDVVILENGCDLDAWQTHFNADAIRPIKDHLDGRWGIGWTTDHRHQPEDPPSAEPDSENPGRPGLLDR